MQEKIKALKITENHDFWDFKKIPRKIKIIEAVITIVTNGAIE